MSYSFKHIINEFINLDTDIMSKLDLSRMEDQLYFVHLDPKNIELIDNALLETQKYVVLQNPENIKYIKNPDEEVQMFVIRVNPKYAKLIQHISTSVKNYLIWNYENALDYIYEPNEHGFLDTIKSISHWNKPSIPF